MHCWFLAGFPNRKTGFHRSHLNPTGGQLCNTGCFTISGTTALKSILIAVEPALDGIYGGGACGFNLQECLDRLAPLWGVTTGIDQYANIDADKVGVVHKSLSHTVEKFKQCLVDDLLFGDSAGVAVPVGGIIQHKEHIGCFDIFRAGTKNIYIC